MDAGGRASSVFVLPWTAWQANQPEATLTAGHLKVGRPDGPTTSFGCGLKVLRTAVVRLHGAVRQWRSQDFEVGGTTLTSPPPEVGVRGVTPGQILGFYIAVGEFRVFWREKCGFWWRVSSLQFNESTTKGGSRGQGVMPPKRVLECQRGHAPPAACRSQYLFTAHIKLQMRSNLMQYCTCSALYGTYTET